ncbi:MAG: hypothetical protein AB8G22_12210 [Saprospiraceae bacterium]
MKHIILIILLQFISYSFLRAQIIDANFDPADSNQMHYLVTTDGDQFLGKAISLINTELKFLLNQDTITYSLKDIVLIEVIDKRTGASMESNASKEVIKTTESIKIKVIKTGNPRIAAHRNFMSETAFRLRKDESELRNAIVLYNSYDYGLTDHLTVGVQSIIPGLAGFRTKLSFDISEMVHWGMGTSFYLGFWDGRVVNHSFGLLTLGTPDHHLSFSAGHGWSLNEINRFIFDPFGGSTIDDSKPNTPVFTVAGSFRIADQWRVMFEYGTLPQEGEFNRFVNTTVSWFKYRSSLDFGILAYYGDNFFNAALPVVAFGYRFNQKQEFK